MDSTGCKQSCEGQADCIKYVVAELSIEDYTARVQKIRAMLDSGKTSSIKRYLPPEKTFSLKNRSSTGLFQAADSDPR